MSKEIKDTLRKFADSQEEKETVDTKESKTETAEGEHGKPESKVEVKENKPEETPEGSGEAPRVGDTEEGEGSEGGESGERKPEATGGELDEESILKYLSEKQGKEFQSIDDLFKTTEVEKVIEKEIEFADDSVKAINEFIEKTGRPAEDYFKLQRDWSEASDDLAAREYLRMKRPSFSEEKLDEYIEAKYKLNPDDYDERDVKLAKLDYESLVSEAKDYLNKEKEKFAKPVDGHKPRGERETESYDWSEQIEGILKEDKIPVETGEFTYYITDKDAVKKRYSSLDSLMKDKSFVDEDGKFNPVKLMKAVELGRNVDKVISGVKQDMETKIREELMKEFPEPGAQREQSQKPETNEKGLTSESKEELLRRMKKIY